MSTRRDRALAALRQRWEHIFSTLAAGGEAPPAWRLRAEGMMETLALLELCTEAELQAELAACYHACCGQPLEADWRDWFPFPQVPGFGQRAPVHPSTE